MSRAAEGLFLLAVAAGPLAFGSVEPWSIAVIELLVVASASCLLLRSPAAALSPVFTAAGLLAALAALQLARPAAWAEPSSWGPVTHAPHATRNALVRLLTFAAALWAGHQLFAPEPARRRLLGVVYAVALVVALVGLVQSVSGSRALYGLRPVERGNPFGPYYNSGNAAALLSLGAFCGLGLALGRSRRGARTPGAVADFWSVQAMLLVGVVVIAAALVVTRSRAAALAAVGGLCALAASGTRLSLARGSIAAAVAAGFALMVYRDPRWLGFYQSFGDRFDISTVYRFSMYGSGLRLLADFPLWGVGAGAARFVFPAYQDPTISGLVEYLHSDWLETAVAFGLPAAILLGAAVAVALRRGFAREPEAAAVAAGLAAFLMHALLDFPFQIMGNAVVVCALFAWLSAGPSRPLPAPAARAGLLAAAVLAVLIVRPAWAPRSSDACGLDAGCWARRAEANRAGGRLGDFAADVERLRRLSF